MNMTGLAIGTRTTSHDRVEAMPFRLPDENVALRAFVEHELSKRASSRLYTGLLGSAPEIGTEIPAYVIHYSSLRGGGDVNIAIKRGARYPIRGDNSLGLAVINLTKGRRPTFGGLLFGELPKRLVRAARFVEQQLVNSATVYEPRLLEIPALQIASLWLVGEMEEIFVPLVDGKGKAGHFLQDAREFMKELEELVIETEARSDQMKR